jgi:hypothetical protein
MGSAWHVEPEQNVGAVAAVPRSVRAQHSREMCVRSAVHR